jgi:heme A synthase
MTGAKSAVGLGLVVLVAAFCFGVDTPISATVAGRSYHCADVIPAGLLVSGQAVGGGPGAPDLRPPAERRLDARVAAACDPLQQRARWAVWGGLGLGGLVVLVGWTAVRERDDGRDHDRPRAVLA